MYLAGIAVYPGGAKFLACGHYYNNVVTSKGIYSLYIIDQEYYITYNMPIVTSMVHVVRS